MTTWYLDLVNGNDSNAGTSWGAAWKTFASGPTSARIAAGDEIRVAQTPSSSVGTATWTNDKVGNSITFASAPTKQIDNCKTGWVTMGAGSTVTNGQTTAFMMPALFNGTTGAALQWTTAASANGAYKDLGSTIDFSGYQQVCFWFRSGTALDCTTTQNLLVDLCSDAGATTVVTALTAPKWSYAANMWYPIVIDFGSALSSTVRSVRIRTTNTTTQTFYIDEMFASPAAGLTLHSLIGKGDADWYPIRTIRDADVVLLGSYSPGTAAGANAIIGAVACTASWMGTTTTATTYKLETFKSYGTSGPAGITGLTLTKSGTQTSPIRYTGGWDTSSGLQTGVTFLDNLTHVTSALGINLAFSYNAFDKFGFVRWTSNTPSGTEAAFTNTSIIGNGAWSSNTSALLSNTMSTALGIVGPSYSAIHSNAGVITVVSDSTSPTNSGQTITIGNCWGNGGQLVLNGRGLTYNVGNIYNFASSGSSLTCTAYGSTFKVGDVKTPNASLPTQLGNSCFGSFSVARCNFSFGDCLSRVTNGGSGLGSNNIFYFKSFTTGTPFATANSFPVDENVFYIDSWSSAANLAPAGYGYLNSKWYFHNLNGVQGYFKVFVYDATSGVPPNFELDAVDVYTAGSKAVKFNGSNYSSASTFGARVDLKLASAAAVANKLVTVTAQVKRNASGIETGIYIPCLTHMVPGYTTDITQSITSVGSWELVTITFTPTADCVFDVMAYTKATGVCTPTCNWDALTISQAA